MSKMFIINDISGHSDQAVQHAGQFLPYAHKKLGFNKPVGVNFISDPENAKDPLGKTAYYDPNKMEITIFVDKRHVKDILRSLSHELVHHSQNCRGDFDSNVATEPGYAQKNPHMRKMEAEAYLLGNGFLFRDWEDQLKQKKEKITMSEGKKEKGREECPPGQEKKGYDDKTGKMFCVDKKKKELEEQSKTDSPDRVSGRDTSGRRLDEEELEEGMPAADMPKDKPCPENQVKDKKTGKCVPLAEEGLEEEVNENWTHKNKDSLLFERLVKLWAK